VIRVPTLSSSQKKTLSNQFILVRIKRRQERAVGLEQIKAVRLPAIITVPPGIGVAIEIMPRSKRRLAMIVTKRFSILLKGSAF